MLYVMSTQEVFEKRPVMESTSVTDIIRFAVIIEITQVSKKGAYAGKKITIMNLYDFALVKQLENHWYLLFL